MQKVPAQEVPSRLFPASARPRPPPLWYFHAFTRLSALKGNISGFVRHPYVVDLIIQILFCAFAYLLKFICKPLVNSQLFGDPLGTYAEW